MNNEEFQELLKNNHSLIFVLIICRDGVLKTGIKRVFESKIKIFGKKMEVPLEYVNVTIVGRKRLKKPYIAFVAQEGLYRPFSLRDSSR